MSWNLVDQYHQAMKNALGWLTSPNAAELAVPKAAEELRQALASREQPIEKYKVIMEFFVEVEPANFKVDSSPEAISFWIKDAYGDQPDMIVPHIKKDNIKIIDVTLDIEDNKME